jgi:hypothetical protein
MPKFTIDIHGRGSEINAHNISSEQKEKLNHLNLDECILEDVADILEFDDTFSLIESDEIYIGAHPENSRLTVTQQDNETEVFSDEINSLIFSETISNKTSTTEIYQKNKLYVNDNIKGTFFTLEFEGEKFEPEFLEIHFTEVEGVELVSSFKYKGEECTFGDYWSKGIVYFLSNE